MKKKVILAFSGGLDTSYCAVYLSREQNLEVKTAFVQTGGFSENGLKEITNRAKTLGVTSHRTLDVTRDYYQKCIRYLVFGNVLRNQTYPLSVSAERVFQAMAIAEYAREEKADYIAHGSTGAGNDQIRFDMIFNILAPGLEIMTPIRDQALSRDDEIAYLQKQGIEMDWQQMQYSINAGLWGTSVGGKETLTSDQPLPENAYPTAVSRRDSVDLDLEFTKGELSGINNHTYTDPIKAIQALNEIAAPFGIGRDIHVGDTIIGIKGRVGFEAAAPILIIKAHQALEKHVLTKWQIYWKDQLATWYGMHLHEGHYLDPVMRDMESFMENSQQFVSGRVHICLAEKRFEIKGVSSANDLMSDRFASYGESNRDWSGEDARGFAKIAATQERIYHIIHSGEKS